MKLIVALLFSLGLFLGLAYLISPRLPGYGQQCGGFMGETGPNACPSGFTCRYDNSTGADRSGVCKPSFLPF